MKNTKLYKKQFEYKGQYINYLHKLKENKNIGFICGGIMMNEPGNYTIIYSYK